MGVAFAAEGRTLALARLGHHPAVVTVCASGRWGPPGGEVAYLVLEWLQDLGEYLQRRRAGSDARVGEAQAWALLRPVVEGLSGCGGLPQCSGAARTEAGRTNRRSGWCRESQEGNGPHRGQQVRVLVGRGSATRRSWKAARSGQDRLRQQGRTAHLSGASGAESDGASCGPVPLVLAIECWRENFAVHGAESNDERATESLPSCRKKRKPPARATIQRSISASPPTVLSAVFAVSFIVLVVYASLG